MSDPFFDDARRLAEKAQQLANEHYNRNLLLSENAKLRDELHSINENLQKQLQDAKKSALHSSIISLISVIISAGSLVVAFIALFR